VGFGWSAGRAFILAVNAPKNIAASVTALHPDHIRFMI